MSIEQRRFIRFSLDLSALREDETRERRQIVLQQISVGGCLVEWNDEIFTGDEFRVLLQLPNGNFLPLACKALYKFPGRGIGAKFVEITEFEQQLLADIISQSLENEGLPLQVDPFAHPPSYIGAKKLSEEEKLIDSRLKDEEIVDEILSLDN